MKFFFPFILFISILLLSTSCIEKSKINFINAGLDSTIKVQKISFKNLIKTYKSLHGQFVEVEGHGLFGFELSALCRKNDLFDDDQACFWLEFSRDLKINDSLILFASGHKFILKGRIDTTQKGHLNFYPAALTDIYYLKVK